MSASDPAAEATLYRARVNVFPRPQILDPQGKAIGEALGRVGFDEVRAVRAGKTFDIELEATDVEAAAERLREICETLLANTIVEDFSFDLELAS